MSGAWDEFGASFESRPAGGWAKPPRPARSCNLHQDCNAIDDEAWDDETGLWRRRKPYHCHIDDCEDCFGC